jgi:hypothetical protein
MRFRTFFVAGVEVLQLGGEKWESNTWPPEHWRTNSGRWRLATEAIDAHMATELHGLRFGPTVDGFVLALEVADLGRWPAGAFTASNAPPSYKRKHRDLWCFGQLDWLDIQFLTLEEQYEHYGRCLLGAIGRLNEASRMPRGFEIDAFRSRVADALARGGVSQFTRAAYYGS